MSRSNARSVSRLQTKPGWLSLLGGVPFSGQLFLTQLLDYYWPLQSKLNGMEGYYLVLSQLQACPAHRGGLGTLFPQLRQLGVGKTQSAESFCLLCFRLRRQKTSDWHLLSSWCCCGHIPGLCPIGSSRYPAPSSPSTRRKAPLASLLLLLSVAG